MVKKTVSILLVLFLLFTLVILVSCDSTKHRNYKNHNPNSVVFPPRRGPYKLPGSWNETAVKKNY